MESAKYIDTIKYGFDKNRRYGYYNEVDYVVYDNNTRGMTITWCVQNMIPYYSKREYDISLMTEKEAQAVFGDCDWNYMDLSEQLVFKDNIVYLMIY